MLKADAEGFLGKMVEQVKGVLATCHDHITITTELRTPTIDNSLKSSRNKALQQRIYRRSNLETGRRGRDVERAGQTPTCDH